jgi:hypothetical protein
VPVDYRYHIGSLVAIFLAILLGILVGIGLAPNPQELDRVVSQLKTEYISERDAKEQEIEELKSAARDSDLLVRETVAALIKNRLQGKRVAIIADHEFGSDELPDTLRAALKQAGVQVTSTTTVTQKFVALPATMRDTLAPRLGLYPRQGVHFRTALAEGLAQAIGDGQPDFVLSLQSQGLLKTSADSNYRMRPDAVVIIGGADDESDIAPERIDLPLIRELSRKGLRVVGAEPKEVKVSVIPVYRAAGVPTVDDADTLAGRLSVVLLLAGGEGHYGVKDTADHFLPVIPAAGPR